MRIAVHVGAQTGQSLVHITGLFMVPWAWPGIHEQGLCLFPVAIFVPVANRLQQLTFPNYVLVFCLRLNGDDAVQHTRPPTGPEETPGRYVCWKGFGAFERLDKKHEAFPGQHIFLLFQCIDLTSFHE